MESAWFCQFDWGRVFDGVGKGFAFSVDIFTPEMLIAKCSPIKTMKVLRGKFEMQSFENLFKNL